VQDDPAWETVPQVLRDAVTYDGQVIGLPSAQFIMGYFINQDLFEAANLDAPTYGVAADELFEAASELTNVQQGVLGLHEMGPILGWYASTEDSNLGWFSFDGSNMNYNSDSFRNAVNAALEMMPNTWQGLTEDQRSRFTSQGPWELFVNQESGAVWEGGWAIPNFAQNATFNWDFAGIPGGNQAIVLDLLVVSNTASDLDAAYDFARWMSFSPEGYAREAELAVAAELVPTRMPVSITPETIDLYLSIVGDRPGLRQALENLDNSLVESLAKIVPGYINARWEGRPGINIGENMDVSLGFIFDNIASAEFKFEDYAPQLEEFANGILADARAELAS
jgi:ABC-type glycerol-3-phosphate transport system substrate-binding protein